MKFSIVIPLFNKEEYISRAIESVLSQTYESFELIVVDDGSTDHGATIVEGFSDPRIVLIHQINGGESAARNTGIGKASNPFVAFLDADDAWRPNHLETLLQLILKYPGSGIFCTNYQFFEANGKIRVPSWKFVSNSGIVDRYFRSVANGDQLATSSSACIPASVFQDVGLFSVGDKLGADQDMWARILLKYKIACSQDITAKYFRDASNRVCITNSPNCELPYSKRLQAQLDEGLITGVTASDVCDYIASGLLALISLNIRTGRRDVAKMLLTDRRLHRNDRKVLFWTILANVPDTIAKPTLYLVDRVRNK